VNETTPEGYELCLDCDELIDSHRNGTARHCAICSEEPEDCKGHPAPTPTAEKAGGEDARLAEWRAMAQQPEALSVRQLNAAVRWLRERIYQDRLAYQSTLAAKDEEIGKLRERWEYDLTVARELIVDAEADRDKYRVENESLRQRVDVAVGLETAMQQVAAKLAKWKCGASGADHHQHNCDCTFIEELESLANAFTEGKKE
jgi:hypothetical protein